MAPVYAALLFDQLSAAVAARHDQLRTSRGGTHGRRLPGRSAPVGPRRLAGVFLGWLQRGQLGTPEPPAPPMPYPREPESTWVPSNRR